MDSGIWSNFPNGCTYTHPCLSKLVYFMLSLLLLSMVEFLLIKYFFFFGFKVSLLQCFHAYLLELFKIKAQLLKLLFIFYLFSLFSCEVLGECFFYSYNFIYRLLSFPWCVFNSWKWLFLPLCTNKFGITSVKIIHFYLHD